MLLVSGCLSAGKVGLSEGAERPVAVGAAAFSLSSVFFVDDAHGHVQDWLGD